MMALSPLLLREFIDIGRGDEARVPPILAGHRDGTRQLLCGHAPWRAIAETIPGVRDLEYLIRGLVQYSRAIGYSIGGSVSPVLPLYSVFVRRFPREEPELTAWIVEHRINGYEPFGTLYDFGAKTYADFISRREIKERRSYHSQLLEDERQARAREARETRERRQSTELLAAAVRRGDLAAVMALLAKGADVVRAAPAGTSLIALAEEHGRTAVAEFLKGKGAQ